MRCNKSKSCIANANGSTAPHGFRVLLIVRRTSRDAAIRDSILPFQPPKLDIRVKTQWAFSDSLAFGVPRRCISVLHRHKSSCGRSLVLVSIQMIARRSPIGCPQNASSRLADSIGAALCWITVTKSSIEYGHEIGRTLAHPFMQVRQLEDGGVRWRRKEKTRSGSFRSSSGHN